MNEMSIKMNISENVINEMDLTPNERNMFIHFLRIISEMVALHSNDESSPGTMEGVISSIKKLQDKMEEAGYPMSTHDATENIIHLSPKVHRLGYSRLKRTDCDNYQYGILFAVAIERYRDTTGLGDAISCITHYAMTFLWNEATNFNTQITIMEGGNKDYAVEMRNIKNMPLPILIHMLEGSK